MKARKKRNKLNPKIAQKPEFPSKHQSPTSVYKTNILHPSFPSGNYNHLKPNTQNQNTKKKQKLELRWNPSHKLIIVFMRNLKHNLSGQLMRDWTLSWSMYQVCFWFNFLWCLLIVNIGLSSWFGVILELARQYILWLQFCCSGLLIRIADHEAYSMIIWLYRYVYIGTHC